MADRETEPRSIGQLQQGIPVLDPGGVLLGSVRDQSAGSFLLWRNQERDVIWVSKTAVARVEPLRIVLGCQLDQA